uniref:Uncharacterized protein n=1 Tax=Knipowitschia caucasica TaxID=637954 RepID=A0AAV2KH73_KNICA
MESQVEMLQRLRASFSSRVTVPESFRRSQLLQLQSLLQENEQLLLDALHKDLAKPKFEAVLSELAIVANELIFALSNLRSWLQLEHVTRTMVQHTINTINTINTP